MIYFVWTNLISWAKWVVQWVQLGLVSLLWLLVHQLVSVTSSVCSSFHLTSIPCPPFCFTSILIHHSSFIHLVLFCFVVDVCFGWCGMGETPMLLWACTWWLVVSLSCGRQRQLSWICSVLASHWFFVHGLSLRLSNGKAPCMEIQCGVAGYKFSWVLLSHQLTSQYNLVMHLGSRGQVTSGL